METAYAQALWDLIAKGTAPKRAVELLHTHLEARGRAALMPRIAKAFARIAERDRERNGVTLYVADASDEQSAKRAAKEALEALRANGAEVHVTIDKSLIGGWRLEGKEALVDASYKHYLLDMYNRVTN